MIIESCIRCASERTRRRALGLLEQWGTHGLCHVGLSAEKSLFLPGGERGFVSFAIKDGVAIALGDPVAPPEAMIDVAREFRALGDAQRWAGVAFFAASEQSLPALRSAGFRAIAMGAEPIVDVQDFQLSGRARKSLRQAYNHGLRAGVRAVEYRPWEARRPDWESGIARVDEAWLRAMGGASLQAMTDVALVGPEACGARRIFLALHEERVVAVSLLLPVPARRAWSMHMSRRDPAAPRGAMEVLDVETLRTLAAEGVREVSFGMCVMAHLPEEAQRSLLHRLMKAAMARLSPVYDVAGLTAYKEKFAPSAWETRYLAFAPAWALRRVATALIRAQVPGGVSGLWRSLSAEERDNPIAA